MSEIPDYYALGLESDRLKSGNSQLEFVRTQDCILRHIDQSIPAKILDVGGGPGAYSFWLASHGHQVHLIDLIPLHIEQAQKFSIENNIPLASATVGNAQQLEISDSTMDIVLLLGPLYHLTQRKERIQALREAHRVLLPNGLLFAAAISHFASLLDGLFRKLVDDPDFIRILERDLKEGQHRNPTDHPEYFTTAFFHRLEELKAEVEDAGFVVENILGLEGPAWLMPDFDQRWQDKVFRNRLLNYLQIIESEPSIVGMSAHMLAIAKKR